jgi:hypothetical protein
VRRTLLLPVFVLFSCQPGQLDTATGSGAIRPDHPSAPNTDPRFDLNETVETWVSPGGRVKLHFSRAGTNAVPATDADMSGVPDYVELAGRTYDQVRDLYHGPLGLREPISDALLGGMHDGGDDLFDVYLLDFNLRGDGAFRREECDMMRRGECTGFMIQENDFVGYGYPTLAYACRVLASHEYFHAVQAAYDWNQDSIFAESTAVWGTERFDPTLEDFEAFVEAYYTAPDRPLNVVSGGVTDAKSYGTAIFFQFLDERFDPLVVPKLLLEVSDGQNGVADPFWFDRLDPFLMREYGASFADTFSEFAIWNLYTSARADPSKSYENGGGYPRILPEEIALPYSLDNPRFFPAAAKYFIADVDGRSSISAALVAPDAELSELEGLRIYLTALSSGRIVEPKQITDIRAGTETVDTSVAERVIAVVINTNLEGASKRPDFCLGEAAEVEACIAANTPPPPDAGVPDAGTPMEQADAGIGEMPMPIDEDTGCSAVPAQDGAALWILSLLAIAMIKRSRK